MNRRRELRLRLCSHRNVSVSLNRLVPRDFLLSLLPLWNSMLPLVRSTGGHLQVCYRLHVQRASIIDTCVALPTVHLIDRINSRANLHQDIILKQHLTATNYRWDRCWRIASRPSDPSNVFFQYTELYRSNVYVFFLLLNSYQCHSRSASRANILSHPSLTRRASNL